MINFLPKTKFGRWSVGLIIAFFIFLSIFYLLIALGQRGGKTFFSNIYLTIPFLSAAISGIGAFFTGLVSVFRDKESSILVFFSTIIGFFVLLFVLGELLFPH